MNPIAHIHRPTDAQAADGQRQGLDPVLMRDVPLLEFKTLSVSSPEPGGQQVAVATHTMRIWGNPEKPIRHTDYLTIGPYEQSGKAARVLHIQQILDEQNNGQKLTLICGERTP